MSQIFAICQIQKCQLDNLVDFEKYCNTRIYYLLAKIGADTAENERKFAENLPKIGNYPTGPLPYGRKEGGGGGGPDGLHEPPCSRRLMRPPSMKDPTVRTPSYLDRVRAALHREARRKLNRKINKY